MTYKRPVINTSVLIRRPSKSPNTYSLLLYSLRHHTHHGTHSTYSTVINSPVRDFFNTATSTLSLSTLSHKVKPDSVRCHERLDDRNDSQEYVDLVVLIREQQVEGVGRDIFPVHTHTRFSSSHHLPFSAHAIPSSLSRSNHKIQK